MSGLAPKLPLHRDEKDGYALIKSFKELAEQNLKMLILTIPGERMMDPEFGVGLKRYLFEQNHPFVRNDIETEIRSQVSHYLPYINILNVKFTDSTDTDPYGNLLNISIEYLIIPLKTKSSISFDLDYALDTLPL